MQQGRGSHSVYALQAHVVFVTEYRRKLLRGEVQERCRDPVRQTCDALDVRILVVSATTSHLHLSYPAELSVSDLVREVKGRSARKLVLAEVASAEYPGVRRRYGGGFWGIGYGAWSTGAITDEVVDEYREHHRHTEGPNGTENFILE